MSDKNFCCIDNYSVVIPLRDFQKLIDMSTKFDGFVQQIAQLDKECQALHGLYSELLMKVHDLS